MALGWITSWSGSYLTVVTCKNFGLYGRTLSERPDVLASLSRLAEKQLANWRKGHRDTKNVSRQGVPRVPSGSPACPVRESLRPLKCIWHEILYFRITDFLLRWFTQSNLFLKNMMPRELFERFYTWPWGIKSLHKTVLWLGTKLHQNDVTDEMYFLFIDSIWLWVKPLRSLWRHFGANSFPCMG